MKRFFSTARDFFEGLKSEGSFARNFTITFSGNSIAVLVGFLFTPFIARIYSPEAYGLFALFSALVLNIAQVSTLQLTRGYVIPKGEHGFYNLVRATLVSLVCTFLIVSIIIFAFKDTVLTILGGRLLGSWVYLIPAAFVLYAINDILKSKNIREKIFKRNAVNQILSSVMARGSTLVYGVTLSTSFPGLVFGDLISKLFEGFVLAGSQIVSFIKLIFFGWNWKQIRQTLREYRSYPIFVLPGVWLLSLSIQLPVYFFNVYFDSSVAGYYSFASSLLNLPIAILATSTSQVFLQKASETFHQDPDQMPRIVKMLTDRLFLVGLVPISFLMVFGDLVFKYVMGEQWITSGEYTRYMGLYFVFQIINFPLLTLFRIYKKEHLSLVTNLLLVILNLSALYIGKYNENTMYAITLFCVSNMMVYLLSIKLAFSFVGLKFSRSLLIWLGLLVGGVGFFALCRWALKYFLPSL